MRSAELEKVARTRAVSPFARPSSVAQVGFFTTDHWFEPCSAVARAVREAVEGLQAAGHEVVPFEPPVDGWEVSGSALILL